MKNAILIVDDEPNVISALQRTLFDEQYEILSAASGEEGLAVLKEHRVKVVISDERMPGMDGADFLSIVQNRYPETVRIMLTGYASVDAAMKAVNDGGVYRFFVKPWNDLELLLALRTAIEKFDLETENRRLLAKIRDQAMEMKIMERRYSGITRVEKDEQGNLLIPDFSEEEIAEILAECDMESK
ncbi:MAG TPA: response regulator [Geobacteraceae bacterium]